MSRWFRSVAKAHTPAMTADEEDRHLRSVEAALMKLLNDDIDTADKLLKEQDSSFHFLGRGISSFIAAILGGEKELLKDAAAILQVAETKTWEDMKKAQREPGAFRSEIYPPGTEYLLCYSIAQLTSALTSILSGSVTQAISGSYKLRKAYLTLDDIMEVESKHFKRKIASRRTSVASRNETLSRIKTHESTANAHPTSATRGEGRVSNGLTEKALPELSPTNSIPTVSARTKSNVLDVDPESLGITSHADIFIHSGTRLCYGMLLLVFSMIENPIFTKILYIVGVKGDRERGTRYLWQAARFDGFTSATAGICLLGFYNGLVGFCDILPTDEFAANDLAIYPKAKCEALVALRIAKYPESKLWKMEEARMLSYNHKLGAAVKILEENTHGNMKQTAIINLFELSLATMFIHDYEACAKSWINCAELSTWSPCLYAYLTGSSYLELYRNLRKSNPAAAETYRRKAREYIRKGPPLAGRQKVMSKKLPFDVYVVRKVQKWEERAKSWGVDLIDAIGTSPLAEMMYLWNGIKKMAPEQLQKTLNIIEWERTNYPEKLKADLDETAACSIIQACLSRRLGKFDEARTILETQILNHEKHEFRGHLKDDWPNPFAHYEMACLAWDEKDLEGEDSEAKVMECEQWLEKTQKWGETYVLDTRMSFKITTSLFTVKRHKGIMGY